MTLILLVGALLIEIFWVQVSNYRSHQWLVDYSTRWQSVINRDGDLDTRLVACLIVVPPLILLAIITGEVHGALEFLIQFVLSLAVLVWCLGPKSIAQLYTEYLNHEGDESETSRAFFYQVHRSYLAVLFWFLIAGVFGAFIYRMIEVFASRSEENQSNSNLESDEDSGSDAVSENEAVTEKDTDSTSSIDDSQKLQTIWSTLFFYIDWIPARISGFLFLLTGDFVAGLKALQAKLFDIYVDGQAVVEETAMASLAKTENESMLTSARHLCERTIILFVVLVALMALFSLSS